MKWQKIPETVLKIEYWTVAGMFIFATIPNIAAVFFIRPLWPFK
jgi:hypothetical protein